jgi:hypothetical protein
MSDMLIFFIDMELTAYPESCGNSQGRFLFEAVSSKYLKLQALSPIKQWYSG